MIEEVLLSWIGVVSIRAGEEVVEKEGGRGRNSRYLKS
jgi:hypothetical protein